MGAIALAGGAIFSWRMQWLGPVAYAAGTLAILYAILIALSLPVRLAGEGACPAAATSCPLGFERPATPAEMDVIYITVATASLALLLIFMAVELRYFRSLRPARNTHKNPPS
jgi:hypothetical protein